MTEIVLWLIAFALILFFCASKWEASVSAGLNKVVPSVIKSGDGNRWIWSVSLAVLGATTLVRPVDILLTGIILGLIGLLVWKLAPWVMDKANFH